MKRIVLDTNVVVSAFLVPDGKPAAILRLAMRGDYEVCFCTAILAEYEQVLCRPKFAVKIPHSTIHRFFELLRNMGTDIISVPSIIEMPDETDRIFYDTAKASGALLITGNTRHFPDEPFVLTPHQFIESHIN